MSRAQLADDAVICDDPVIRDQWHPICALGEILANHNQTLLLSEPVFFAATDEGYVAWCNKDPTSEVPPSEARHELPVKAAYGYLWTSLGTPPPDLFAIPEFDDPSRRNMNAGSVGVATSAPRAVENFLDLAHFPYVHAGSLGELPHTEVSDYDVEIVDNEVVATKCDFYVPLAAPGAEAAALTRYWYRVPHPFCVLLYYESPGDPSREDIVGLFLQPLTETSVRAHNYMGVFDEVTTDNEIKSYQLLIFGQDKPILENQNPKLLPLDPRAETPIRADKSAIFYRRWLHDLGITYGVIAA